MHTVVVLQDDATFFTLSEDSRFVSLHQGKRDISIFVRAVDLTLSTSPEPYLGTLGTSRGPLPQRTSSPTPQPECCSNTPTPRPHQRPSKTMIAHSGRARRSACSACWASLSRVTHATSFSNAALSPSVRAGPARARHPVAYLRYRGDSESQREAPVDSAPARHTGEWVAETRAWSRRTYGMHWAVEYRAWSGEGGFVILPVVV